LDVTGTWELVVTPTTNPQWTSEIRKLGLTIEAHSAPDLYCIWAGGTAASMLEWYKDQLGFEAIQRSNKGEGNIWTLLMDDARKSTPGANGIFFLPHFNGTTCPNLDPKSLGAFLGLNDTTRQEDLIRAVIEGLDYAFFDMLIALEKGAGQRAEEITVIGGTTRNEFWMQNKADVICRPVVTYEIEEATALGAAMLAGVGSGIYKNLDEAVNKIKKPGKTYEPDTKLTAFYAETFEIYKDIYHALAQVNNKIYNRFRV
jgi:xylulokinase